MGYVGHYNSRKECYNETIKFIKKENKYVIEKQINSWILLREKKTCKLLLLTHLFTGRAPYLCTKIMTSSDGVFANPPVVLFNKFMTNPIIDEYTKYFIHYVKTGRTDLL